MKFLLCAKQGIYQGSIIDDKIKTNLYFPLIGCSYLDAHQEYIFAISEGGISIFDQDELIYQDSSFSVKPSHIHFINDYSLIVASNYHLGLLTIYKFDQKDTKLIQTITYPEGSKIHQAIYDQQRNLLYVTNLGLDLVYIYNLNTHNLVLLTTVTFPPGSGVRHLTFNPAGFIYVLGEYSNDLYTITPNFELIKTTKTLLHDYSKSDSSAIRFNDDYSRLYTLNRFEDYLTEFKIINNLATVPQEYFTLGSQARDFNLDINYLVTANTASNNLSQKLTNHINKRDGHPRLIPFNVKLALQNILHSSN